MKDTYVNAKLIAPDTIRLIVYSALPLEKVEPCLMVDGALGAKRTPTRISSLGPNTVADFRFSSPLMLGKSYFLVMPAYGQIPVDVSEATTFPGFDEKYNYDGDDLGCTYGKKETSFVLWAPLASKVLLQYRDDPSSPWLYAEMRREPKGVYRLSLPGDHEGAEYLYLVTNSEVTVAVTDPYAKGSTANGESSVVVDFSRLKINLHRSALPVMNTPTDAIVYETHVRDMTIDSHSDIVRKGTFLGLCEKGRKTPGGNPAGFDYLVSLGFTHLQLLPIYDYKTADERNPSARYNWGYDPAQYFVPEGSYASVLEDPLSRIRDCKTMIAAFHEKGIRIVMDVVYNHVYEYQSSVFEKVVPNFYFRKRSNGKMANTSGCGNDLASERPMVRKLIVDACKFWIDEYGIDGFRFDLMGIIDIATLNEIKDYARSVDPSFLLYGEGWNMGGEVNVPLGRMENYRQLPDYGFFNDFYRERMKAYWSGDENAKQDYKFAYLSSSLNFIQNARFLNATQTINYVECHDNGTFFDYLSSKRSDLSLESKLALVEVANASILLSLGIPFLHMGQEIGQSKWGEDNTYNKGDHFNKFSYLLLDERFAMVEQLKKAIAYRRKNTFLHAYDPRNIDQVIDINEVEGAVKVELLEFNVIAPRKGITFLINPSSKTIHYPEKGKRKRICFGAPCKEEGNDLVLSPYSLVISELYE